MSPSASGPLLPPAHHNSSVAQRAHLAPKRHRIARPRSMEEWEALWEEDRAAIIDRMRPTVAWIRTLFGHVKDREQPRARGETPVLAVFTVELQRARRDCNKADVYSGIGCVTLDDEHADAAHRSAKLASKASGGPTDERAACSREEKDASS